MLGSGRGLQLPGPNFGPSASAQRGPGRSRLPIGASGTLSNGPSDVVGAADAVPARHRPRV